MDDVVDKYDEVNNYLIFINKRQGVKSNINQEDHKLTYNININLKELDKNDYDLLQISDIAKLKNKKEIKKYYKKQGYTCK